MPTGGGSARRRTDGGPSPLWRGAAHGRPGGRCPALSRWRGWTTRRRPLVPGAARATLGGFGPGRTGRSGRVRWRVRVAHGVPESLEDVLARVGGGRGFRLPCPTLCTPCDAGTVTW
ncbi:hypothetical protein B005_2589 [Nocardiopsis alba ATCC BAA-2165]|uniref:Uncharacterized protein n=1 Tax=Nocardiopsis alba (strain ATCC BAA-2165 / BE74) TaxID=1205910 RepID=J7LFS7_NOCAA|nr:hypothetical protein B005_2589 [Nocardiopsis alba ATCC BAA-2165]